MRRTVLGLALVGFQAASSQKERRQQQPDEVPVQRRIRGGTSSTGPSGAVLSTDDDSLACTRSKSFWCSTAKEVPLHDIHRNYASDRFLDKKTRSAVRQSVRAEGVTSNLYPVHVSPDTVLYVYEIEATRRLLQIQSPVAEREEKRQKKDGSGSAKAKGRQGKNDSKTSTSRVTAAGDGMIKRVDATRAWRVVRRFLQRCVPAPPPLVNVRQKVYAISPIPTSALQLPAECLDLGWTECRLKFLGKSSMAQMSPADLQEVTNKIVLWTLGNQREKDNNFSVARETNGKLVYTHDSFTVGGMRIFKGTIVRAVFVDPSGALEEPASSAAPAAALPAPPSTAVLTTLTAGHHPSEPLRFLVREFVHEFEIKETPVQSYRIEDGSGVIMASLWKATREAKLTAGTVYEATDYRVRVFEKRGGMRLVEMTVGVTTVKPVKDSVKKEQKGKTKNVKENSGAPAGVGKIIPDATRGGALEKMPGVLALKIDTKSTVAAELSLLEEVKQHFGSGPYNAATEERIARSVQGTPVVTSATLRHSIIRFLRFNVAATEVDLESPLQRLLPELEPNQPFAVLNDYSVVPLQALHCCFDPRMKSWQDVTVSSCSFMPTRRLDILRIFHGRLEKEMRSWGLTLAAEPFSTKALSLLPAPQKVFSYGVKKKNDNNNNNNNSDRRGYKENGNSSSLRHPRSPPLPLFPTTIAVVAIAEPHEEEEKRTRITQTAQAIARYYRTTIVITVPDEKEAVRFLLQQLTNASDGSLKDPNTAAVIIAEDRETRPSRWILAECLTRGILGMFMPPAASPKRQTLLCENVRMQLRIKFQTDPAHGINISQEVPALANRRVLVVGVDACHTTTFSTGSVVGMLCTDERNYMLPFFWKHEMRGEEADRVTEHFRLLLQRACELCDHIDEVVLFQDGDVMSEVPQMQAHVPKGCGFTFMCLHKRTNVRFVHRLKDGGKGFPNTTACNVVKGAVVQAITPIQLSDDSVVPSFYLQNHDCNMSTARTVQYTVQSTSPTLDVSDVQQLSYVLSHVLSPQATKLPMATRCAHRLASVAERLLDAAPPLTCDMIPAPLNERLWFF